ncbi:UNVERIFIED_CONTAM: hypothetical protein Sradi_3658700 [Sesamum radiatum]|uniref:Uncharacterized protein n=1 Tax=Sesamum radiatum TaxID=300843 RepID=A0AAW2QIF7_SESRA
MENPNNTVNKQKTTKTPSNTQDLQVTTETSLTPAGGGSAPVPPPLRAIGPVLIPPRRSICLDTSTDELSLVMLEVIQRIVSVAIWEQIATLVPARTATPFDVDVPKEEAEECIPPPIVGRQGAPLGAPQEVPPHWLAHFECLQKGLQDIRY